MAQQTLSSTSWMVDAPWPVSWLTGPTARTPPSRVPGPWRHIPVVRPKGGPRGVWRERSQGAGASSWRSHVGDSATRRARVPGVARQTGMWRQGPRTQWLPARAGAGLPDHSGEGRTGITPDFPFTKAW
ncbi:uncharacterized protein SAZU_5411 [Streptomyces azureus]|uniref:Uncharacterized protein n=1 Tax=Streptomyces azureus TaxID=146537 RepID=A0A0K8PS52_STRAJ|nr:uncharacterized protein SAZU_5411 [Streptomyces azureus]